MLETTKGIFLHHVPYTDTSVIARIYTEKFGQQSYMVQRIRSGKSAPKINLFQPLFQLELEVWYKPGRNIQKIKTIKLLNPVMTIPFNVIKSSQAFFISEVLLKILKEEESNPELFQYLIRSISYLDSEEDGIANFLVVFLFRLTQHLGIFPRLPEEGKCRLFDMESGNFTNIEPFSHAFMDEETTKLFTTLFQTNISDIGTLYFRNQHRSVLLEKLLEYYRIHLDMSSELKSLKVLKEILA